MRIYAGQTANLFQVGEMNPAMNRKHMNQTQQAAAGMRSDMAVISPQGKSSSILANLMNQKEVIQMNKESLIKRSLDEETGTISSGLQEQLEEYEEKLEELDQQIASEMQSGSAAAKYKLDRIEEKERLAEKLEPLLNLFRL